MKNILFLITFIFLVGDVRAQSGTATVRVTNSPTIITSGVSSTSTVFTKPLLSSTISGNHAAQTSPSLNITVPSGQICEVVLSFYGTMNSGADMPVMRLILSSVEVYYLAPQFLNTTAPLRINAQSPVIKLDTGTYTFSTVSSFATNGGNAAYIGTCFIK